MQQVGNQSGVNMKARIALQLFLSHLLAGALALTLCWLFLSARLSPALALALGGLAASVLGLVLTANLQYNLSLLEEALARFVQGLSIERVPGWHWPLTSLFMQLDTLAIQMKALNRNGELMSKFREQVLRQEREAAALEERNRIARDLHDSIKQQIFSISISAAAAKAHWQGSGPDAREALEDIQRSAKEAQVEMVALLQQLRASPLEHTDLAAALRTQAEALGYRTGARVEVAIADLPAPDRLPALAQETLFRIAQEAFANIARHARAETVRLSLCRQGEALVLDIRDDGQGFDPAVVRGGMGLVNLRERGVALGGSLDLESTLGQGTHLRVSIPLLDTEAMRQRRKREEQEVRRATELARSSLQLGQNVSLAAIVVLVLGSLLSQSSLSLLLTGLGILALFYACLRTHFTITRIIFYRGERDRETLSLRMREQGSWLWLIGLLLVTSWNAALFLLSWPFLWESWLALNLVLLVLYSLVRRRRTFYTDCLFEQLPGEELRWEVQERRRRLVRLGRSWLAFLVIDMALYVRVLHLPPVSLTPSDLIGYGLSALLLLYGVLILFDWARLRRWQGLLAARLVKKEDRDDR